MGVDKLCTKGVISGIHRTYRSTQRRESYSLAVRKKANVTADLRRADTN
jgi:hypothetical protein